MANQRKAWLLTASFLLFILNCAMKPIEGKSEWARFVERFIKNAKRQSWSEEKTLSKLSWIFLENELICRKCGMGRELAAVAIKEIGDPSAVPILRKGLAVAEKLEAEEGDIRETIIDYEDAIIEIALALVKLGDDSGIDVLKDMMGHSSTLVRMRTFRALGETGKQSAESLLKEAIKTEDTFTRISIIGALAKVTGGKHYIESLESILAGGLDDRHRSEAAEELGDLNDESVIPLLIEFLKETDDPIYKGYAMIALAKLGAKEAIPLIKAELVRKDGLINSDALTALGILRDKSSIPLLEKLLTKEIEEREHDLFNSTREIFCALAEIGDKSVIPILKRVRHKIMAGYIDTTIYLFRLGEESELERMKNLLINGRTDAGAPSVAKELILWSKKKEKSSAESQLTSPKK